MPTTEEILASSPQLTLDEANEIIREEFEAWATSSANPNAIAPILLIPGSQEYENATKIRTLKVRIIE